MPDDHHLLRRRRTMRALHVPAAGNANGKIVVDLDA
jgi:hypothetical protein